MLLSGDCIIKKKLAGLPVYYRGTNEPCLAPQFKWLEYTFNTVRLAIYIKRNIKVHIGLHSLYSRKLSPKISPFSVAWKGKYPYCVKILFTWKNVLLARLWIEKTNDLVDIKTDTSRNLKGLSATEIANAVREKSLAGVETAIRFFETQPRREREPDS